MSSPRDDGKFGPGPGKEALVWGHTVQGLVRAGLPRSTPRWRERLRACGLDLDAPLAETYTRDQWREFISISAEELFEGTRDERLYRFGEAFIDEYAKTFIGLAASALLRAVGPKRALEKMTKTLRSANNYSETSTTFTGPRRAEFWLSEVLDAPEFIRGSMVAILKRTRAPGIRMRTLDTKGTGATFEVEWDP